MGSKKRGFTLIELLVVITIIGILSSIGLSSFTTAQMKSRDTRRKAHLRQVADSLETYFNDHNQYPNDNGSGSISGANWGSIFKDELANGATYMVQLPQDPTQGQTYYYDALDSNKKFQLYARLENNQDSSLMTLTGPNCRITAPPTCNFGVSSSNITPQEGR